MRSRSGRAAIVVVLWLGLGAVVPLAGAQPTAMAAGSQRDRDCTIRCCQKRRRSRNWTPYSARRPGSTGTPVAGRVRTEVVWGDLAAESLAAPSPATDMRPRWFAVSQSTSAPRPDSRVWRQRKESRSGAHFDRCARSTGCTYQGPVAGTPGASYSSLGHLIWPYWRRREGRGGSVGRVTRWLC